MFSSLFRISYSVLEILLSIHYIKFTWPFVPKMVCFHGENKWFSKQMVFTFWRLGDASVAVSRLIIGSYNSLVPVRHQAIAWTNADLTSINFEIKQRGCCGIRRKMLLGSFEFDQLLQSHLVATNTYHCNGKVVTGTVLSIHNQARNWMLSFWQFFMMISWYNVHCDDISVSVFRVWIEMEKKPWECFCYPVRCSVRPTWRGSPVHR